MAGTNRTAQLTKLHRVLKKSYKPVTVEMNRPVLEQMLFACCLEDAHYQKAEEAFACLFSAFFDLNEVRVSTVKELAEALPMLPAPADAASRVKRVLQSVFESAYSFEMEALRKKNLGQAVSQLQKIEGATPFTVAFVVQNALGGHSIPVGRGAINAMGVIGLVDEKDAAAGRVPGLDRAIGKSKGAEFSTLLQQFGADFAANPYSPSLHKVLLQVNPGAKERLPRRPTKKQLEEAKREAARVKREAARAKRAAEAKAAEEKKSAKAKPLTSQTKATKTRPEDRSSTARKKAKTTTKKKKTAAAAKKTAAKKTHSRRLAKRKPR